MKKLILSLLTVGVLLTTAAAQTNDHSFTLGVGLTVHNDNIVAELESGHVFPDLAKSSERNDFKF